jgi:uncharacterized protein YbjT (DUF2867 family)
MILLTGATGTVGVPLARALRAAGHAVRAIVHERGRAALLESMGVELVPGDLSLPESYRDALLGVDRAFLLTPAGPTQAEMEITFIDTAVASGVSLLVKHSAVGADPGAVGVGSGHGAVEKYLKERRVPSVVVRPTQFMQNLLRWAPSIARARALVMPLVDPSVRVNLVDVNDVVGVEATVLTQPGHTGRTYLAAGPELLTYAEVADRLSRGAGTPISLRVVSADRYRLEARNAGAKPGPVEKIIDYHSTLRSGTTSLSVTGGDVARVTGHEPRSVEDFARDNALAFREPRPEAATWMG